MNKGKYRIVTIVVAVLLSALFFVLYGGSDVYAFSMNTSYGVLNDYSSRYYYEFLDDEQKAAYDELEKKFMEKCFDVNGLPLMQSVTLTIYDMSKESVDEIANAFWMDHYYLYWMYTYSYNYGKANIIKVVPNSRYSMYTEKNIQDQYKALCEKTVDVLSEVSKYPTDELKAYYIYTWITENAEYAYDENGGPSELPIDHSMYGNIVNGRSVCEGFAETFTFLCTQCGIPNAVIYGEAGSGSNKEPHDWNIIKLGDKYYYVDTTWDEASAPENYKYAFVAMDDELFNSKHFADDTFNMPADSECATSNINLANTRVRLSRIKPQTVKLYLDPTDSKIKIYNNGLEVPIVDNTFSVETGTVLTFSGADSRQYNFYRGSINDSNLIGEDGTTIGLSTYQISAVARKPKIIGYEAINMKTKSYNDYIFQDIYVVTESGRLSKNVEFNITIDQATKDRADAIKAGDYYVPASFNEKYLPGQRIYKCNYSKTDAENDGLDTSTEIPEYLVTVEYEKTCKLTLKKINGVEPKAYTEDGTRIYSGNMVPYGTHIILTASAQDGEAADSFIYSDSKTKDVQLDGKGFIITDHTTIKCQTSTFEIASVDYEKEVDVNNGTLPSVDMLGLSSSATIKTGDGLIKTYPISWDLSNYDYFEKNACDVVVTGTVSIPDGTYTLKDGVTLSTETTLHVKGASNFSSLETEIPSSITVPAGTIRNYYALGLPVSAEFKDSDGDIVKSEIVWTAGEGNPYEMTGIVKRNGYTYDPIVVKVTEVGETLSLVPAVNVDYDINNQKGNVLTPIASENIIAHISIQSINTHKDRNVVVKIPKGFKGVGVANATLLDGINDVQIKNNDDGTTDVNVEVDDSFKDGYLTFDVAMNSTFTEIKWTYDTGENDIGRLYPSFSDIPIIISYVAKEDGATKSIDLDYKEHLTMGGGIEYMAEPSFTNYLSLSVPIEKYQDAYTIPSYDAKASKNTSYLEEFQVIYPINEKLNCEILKYRGENAVFDEESNSIIYTRGKGTVYSESYNRDKLYPNNDDIYNIYYELHAKDGSEINAGMTYSSDKPIYAIGIDYFGNEYIRTFKKTSLSIWPYDENTNVTITPVYYARVQNKVDMYNFDMSIEAYKSTDNVSLKPINEMELKLEIPDGTTVAGMQLLSRASKVKFVYWDGTSEELSVEDIKNNCNTITACGDFVSVVSAYSDISVFGNANRNIYVFDDDITNRGGDGIKEFIITIDSIKDTYKGEVRLLLSGTNNYTDNTRVEYGSYFTLNSLPNDYETDCPITEMPITLTVDNRSYSSKSRLIYEVTDNNTEWESSSDYFYTPYKAKDELTFSGSDYFDLIQKSSDGNLIKLTDNTRVYDTIISSEFIGDPEIFNIHSMTISFSKIELDENSGAKASFVCSDGNTYEFDLYKVFKYREYTYDAPEGEYILDYYISIDEMSVSDENKIQIKKEYTVNWDKWIEKGYIAEQEYDISLASIASSNVKEDSSLGGVIVNGTVAVDYLLRTSPMTRTYDDESSGAITAISAFEQTDGCTVKFSYRTNNNGVYMDEYNARSLGITIPLVFKEIIIGVSTGNNELKLCDEEMPGLYDIDGNLLGMADQIETAGSIYKLHFKDITLDNVSELYTQFRIKPTSSIKPGTYTLQCQVFAAIPDGEAMQTLWDEQKPSDVHSKITMKEKGFSSFSRHVDTYRTDVINVLTAYSENAAMYGRTAENLDNNLEEYNVAGEETYDAVLHIFSGPDKQLSGFETTINIPRNNTNITVNGKTYTNTFDGTFAGISAGSGVVNPHYYYKKAASENEEEPEYVEFSGDAADIENPEEIIAIKVTADSVTNDDEITIKLKAPEADAKREAYIYSDIKYDNGNKSILTNVVKYVLGAGLEPVDPGIVDPGTQGGEDPGTQGGEDPGPQGGEIATPGDPGEIATPGDPGEIATPGEPGEIATPGDPGQDPGTQGGETGTPEAQGGVTPELQGGETETPGVQGGETVIPAEQEEETVNPAEQEVETVNPADQEGETVTPVEQETEQGISDNKMTGTETTEDSGKTQVVTYTISFDTNGGTLDGESGIITMAVEEGTTITIPAGPVRDGYKFTYWKGSEYYPGDSYTVTGDHTFTAQWEADTAEAAKTTGTTEAEKNTKGYNDSVVNTGDDSNLVLCIILLLAALSGIYLTTKIRSKN